MSLATATQETKSAGVPFGILAGAAGLIGFAVLAVGFSVVADVGKDRMPTLQTQEQLALRFEDRDDGAVAVRDAADGKVIHVIAPGTNGFIRATMRGLTRERIRSGVGAEPPFLLTHWSDGTISLEDKTTGRRIGLDAFGPTNSAAFAQLFTSRRALP